MAVFTKRKLSQSTDGGPIGVAGTSSPGTAIHVAVAGTTPGTYDEIWLWASNAGSANYNLTVEFGGTSNPFVQPIPFQAGLFLVCPGLPLQNGCTCGVYASLANIISIFGFVNTMTD